jgi:glutathione synthase/RimK-type ligase-like ATP-grasp enzyme
VVSRGRVAIVGSELLKEELMPEFSKRFSTVVFFTPGSIKLTAGETLSATSGRFNLANFDYVLLLPETSEKEFYYTLARILEKKTRVSIPSGTLAYFWNKPVLLNRLAVGGVPIRKTVSVSQDVAADFIHHDFKLPVVLTTPQNKRVYVSNEETLRNVLSLFSAGHMISVQKPVRKAEVHVTFASEREVIGYCRRGERRVSIRLDQKTAAMVQKVRKTLGADFCEVILVKMGRRFYLSNLKFIPNLELFTKVLGRNVASLMAEEATHKIAAIDPVAIAEKAVIGFGNALQGIASWIANEISDTRSPK